MDDQEVLEAEALRAELKKEYAELKHRLRHHYLSAKQRDDSQLLEIMQILYKGSLHREI